jgi:hypothetical protein
MNDQYLDNRLDNSKQSESMIEQSKDSKS